MFIKKTIELNSEDLQHILVNTTIKELSNEFFARDAELIVDHLNESQQLELLQQLLKPNSSSPEIEEELKYQMSRRNLHIFENLTLYEKMKHILKEYHLSSILKTLAQLLRDKKS